MPTGREHRTVTRKDGALRPAITEEARALRMISTVLAGKVVEAKVGGSTGDPSNNPPVNDDHEVKPKFVPGHGCGERGTADLTGKKIPCDEQDPDEEVNPS